MSPFVSSLDTLEIRSTNMACLARISWSQCSGLANDFRYPEGVGILALFSTKRLS